MQDGRWQALIVQGGWTKHFEFSQFDPTGTFFLQRVMQDDLTDKIQPGVALDVVLMVYRVAEVLAVGVSMARALGWEADTCANFALRWSGLKDRALTTWARPLWTAGSGRESRSPDAEAFVRLPVETPHNALAPHVRIAVGPLFALFEGYSPSQELIESCVRKMVERTMAS